MINKYCNYKITPKSSSGWVCMYGQVNSSPTLEKKKSFSKAGDHQKCFCHNCWNDKPPTPLHPHPEIKTICRSRCNQLQRYTEIFTHGWTVTDFLPSLSTTLSVSKLPLLKEIYNKLYCVHDKLLHQHENSSLWFGFSRRGSRPLDLLQLTMRRAKTCFTCH